MSKELSVLLLGIAVVIIPYLGVPSMWRTLLLVLVGITLICIGFLMRSHGMRRGGNPSPYQPFVESQPDQTPQHEHKEGITSLN